MGSQPVAQQRERVYIIIIVTRGKKNLIPKIPPCYDSTSALFIIDASVPRGLTGGSDSAG